MKFVTRLMLPATLVLFLSGPVIAETCPWSQPHDLLITDFDGLKTQNHQLTPGEVREDLACLKLIFSRQYSGDFFYKNRGINLEERVDQLAASISAPEDQSHLLPQLLALHKDAYDAHIGYEIYTSTHHFFHLPSYDEFYVPRSAIPVGMRIKSCERLKPVEALAADGKTIYTAFAGQFSLAQSAPTTVSCKVGANTTISLPLMRKSLDHLFPALSQFHFKMLDNDTLYVRFPNMLTVDTDPEKFQRLITLLSNESIEFKLLFDLRQNPGGNSSIPEAIGKTLRWRRDKPPKIMNTNIESLYSWASLANSSFIIWKMLEHAGQPAANAKAAYDQYLDFFHQQVSSETLEYLKIERREDNHTPGLRLKPYSKPIILLVDKVCASACDEMVQQLEGTRSVRVIGTHTHEAMDFGNVGLMQLPHSKFLVDSGWSVIEPRNDIPEGIGYKPNLYILESDGLETAMKFLDAPGY